MVVNVLRDIPNNEISFWIIFSKERLKLKQMRFAMGKCLHHRNHAAYRTCRKITQEIHPMRCFLLTILGDLGNPAIRKLTRTKLPCHFRTVWIDQYPVLPLTMIKVYIIEANPRGFQNGTIYLQKHTGNLNVNLCRVKVDVG